MKSLKILTLTALLATGSIFATTPTKEKEPINVSQQVSELLKNPSFEVEKDLFATVTLIVNDNDELIVLNVNTINDKIGNFIKKRLNYRKLEGAISDNQFLVSVRIVPEA